MTQEKIVEKLRKIKAHADSASAIGNEEEAQAFAATLQRLLTEHKLSMTDVEYAQHVKDEPVVEHTMETDTVKDEKGRWRRVYAEYPDVEIRRRRVEWIETLAGVIARTHSCDILIVPGSSRIFFVGMTSNVQVVEYLFVTLQRAAEKIADRAYGERWHELLRNGEPVQLCRGFRQSFLDGFVMRLIQRFDEEKRKLEESMRGGSSTALVRLNKEALAVKKYLDKKYNFDENGKERKDNKASALRSSSTYNAEGYRRGKAAADRVDLKANAVKEGRPNAQLSE